MGERSQGLAAARSAAKICEAHTGIPAELLVAQWALESGWGQHEPGNNCFGIKAYAGCYGRQLLQTREWFTDTELKHFLAGDQGRTATLTGNVVKGRNEYLVRDWFATFPSLADCFDRRAEMFNLGRYKPLADQYHKDGNLEALIRGIASIYATAPDYADQLLAILHKISQSPA